jgi:hypothetical protein
MSLPFPYAEWITKTAKESGKESRGKLLKRLDEALKAFEDADKANELTSDHYEEVFDTFAAWLENKKNNNDVEGVVRRNSHHLIEKLAGWLKADKRFAHRLIYLPRVMGLILPPRHSGSVPDDDMEEKVAPPPARGVAGRAIAPPPLRYSGSVHADDMEEKEVLPPLPSSSPPPRPLIHQHHQQHRVDAYADEMDEKGPSWLETRLKKYDSDWNDLTIVDHPTGGAGYEYVKVFKEKNDFEIKQAIESLRDAASLKAEGQEDPKYWVIYGHFARNQVQILAKRERVARVKRNAQFQDAKIALCHTCAAVVVNFLVNDPDLDPYPIEVVGPSKAKGGDHYFVMVGRENAGHERGLLRRRDWGGDCFVVDAWWSNMDHGTAVYQADAYANMLQPETLICYLPAGTRNRDPLRGALNPE